ncbi:hypothetical protein BASA81_006511 [Batrachochytrium salamandrivorans]|nr:hypothetical protein BASA81_006511 [Batrachochytrium salamandrivorans]
MPPPQKKNVRGIFAPLFRVEDDPNTLEASLYYCSLCSVQVPVRRQGKRTRYRYEHLMHHFRDHHPSEFVATMTNTGKNGPPPPGAEVESAQPALRFALGTSPDKFTLHQNVNVVPLAPPRRLAAVNKRYLYLELARWVTECDLPKNLWQQPSSQRVMKLMGFNELPSSIMISKSQAALAAECLEDMTKRVQSIVDFSHMPLISLTVGSWTNHKGQQQVGVYLTFVDPSLCESVGFFLPLESATGESLTAKTEGELIKRTIGQVKLSPNQVHMITTDNAKKRAKSAAKGCFECLSHSANLVLNDMFSIKHKSSEDVPFSQGKAGQYFAGAVARADYFNSNPTNTRLLLKCQTGNELPSLVPKSLANTRWLSRYANVAQDVRIFSSPQVIEFMESHFEASSSHDKLVVTAEDMEVGKLLQGAMHALHLLDLQLQGAHLSLAEAYLFVLDAWRMYCGGEIPHADNDGWVVAKAAWEQVQTLLANVDPSIASFFTGLGECIEKRLVDDGLCDLTLVSMFLDPYTMDTLDLMSTLTGRFGDKVKEILDKVDLVGERLIVPKMVAVAKARNRVQMTTTTTTTTTTSTLNSGSVTEFRALLKRQRVEETTAAVATAAAATAAEDDTMQQMTAQLDAFVELRDGCEEKDLDFWRSHCFQFPELYHVFLQNRGIRPSTTKFNGSSPHQTSLTPETVNAALIIKTYDLDRLDLRDLARRLVWVDPQPQRLARAEPKAAQQKEGSDSSDQEEPSKELIAMLSVASNEEDTN